MPTRVSDFDPATESDWAVRLRSHVPHHPLTPNTPDEVRHEDISDILMDDGDIAILYLTDNRWASVSAGCIWVSEDLHQLISFGLIGTERAALGIPEDSADRWRWVLRVEDAYAQ
jgi:hypothetical protein